MTDTWIFGYGSLVWKPGFAYEERRLGYVQGWRRRFWQASPDHRGTPDAPGRVATMLRWPHARCWGAAYRLGADAEAVLEALDRREIAGYHREVLPINDADGRPFAEALTWVASVDNPNYIGLASIADMAAQIEAAAGPSGANRDYVLQLAEALRGIEAPDDQIFAIERALQAR